MIKMDDFTIVKDKKAAKIYVDAKGRDYDGLSLVAQSFANDINLVVDTVPMVTTDISLLDGTIIVVGSIGNNDLIDRLICEGKIDVSPIKDKWECYRICVVERPVPGVDRAMVIVGSDKRGTIYGIYHISELIGVSPWVYWADVLPAKKFVLDIPEDKLNFTSKEPSVKYRGIFLNDEWPSLGTWTTNKFGDFNEDLYVKVFELLLRLKGNFLWPAMWSAIFSENGKSSSIANAKLADAYGIVMSTSHHEPMFRAGEEWQKHYKRYGTSNEWNFANNKDAITKFWEDGVKRNKDYQNVITLGMRGERDSSLDGGLQENIDLLKSIITTQKELLKKYSLDNAPQVLTIYKEVEEFWYGTETVEGLKNWNVLDDVIIMLAEDNFGNMRTLPTPADRDRKAGWGMYYHFDYHGGPISYEWVNTVPLEKVWEQMTMAYEYGIQDIWIVNVGDLKPMEFPISYFLNLAYDFEMWGRNGLNKTGEFTKKWVKQQFCGVTNNETLQGIATVLSRYTRINGIRKPETLTCETFSTTYYNEAQRVLAQAISLENDAKKYYSKMPEHFKDTYYQLIYYPAVASANVVKMQIYAGLNKKYYHIKSVLANKYAALVEETITADKQMQSYYNDTMSGGKWQGIMGSAHIGYINWDSTGWHYPEVNCIIPSAVAHMIVDIEGNEKGYSSGTAIFPAFTNLMKETYRVTISNGGTDKFNFNIETSGDWVKANLVKGSITDGETIQVSVDWDKVAKTTRGFIKISGAGQTVSVNINAKVIDVGSLPQMTFVETNNVVSIEAEHTSNRVAKSDVEWKVIENYGRTLSSAKMFPITVSFEKTEDAPYLEYMIYLEQEGEFVLTAFFAPTNNLSKESRLKYGVSFDDSAPVVVDTLPDDFAAGNHDNEAWCKGVMENIHTTTTTHRLGKGIHILRIYGLDAGLVLQKLVLSNGILPYSYLGPEESYYKK
ncbi:glycosyl hydrolase 115 family protein [Ruminiclostridium papyrosolvens]|uniref:Gylcosyl hydrolase 115 C-terminal domain-containing protein n=1 Tax=Ruminiclostridium papyrosolvens C7 TaxID=1330534 RepID=U4R4C6_9FIRM|nr:glycosyl hydrolase 115 family protein [Ruminiclostridium papyrosolvens]EPR12846.1 hypothetical protein L323_06945 [Ruminiclostridium papyrosolvens C7]